MSAFPFCSWLWLSIYNTTSGSSSLLFWDHVHRNFLPRPSVSATIGIKAACKAASITWAAASTRGASFEWVWWFTTWLSAGFTSRCSLVDDACEILLVLKINPPSSCHANEAHEEDCLHVDWYSLSKQEYFFISKRYNEAKTSDKLSILRIFSSISINYCLRNLILSKAQKCIVTKVKQDNILQSPEHKPPRIYAQPIIYAPYIVSSRASSPQGKIKKIQFLQKWILQSYFQKWLPTTPFLNRPPFS